MIKNLENLMYTILSNSRLTKRLPDKIFNKIKNNLYTKQFAKTLDLEKDYNFICSSIPENVIQVLINNTYITEKVLNNYRFNNPIWELFSKYINIRVLEKFPEYIDYDKVLLNESLLYDNKLTESFVRNNIDKFDMYSLSAFPELFSADFLIEIKDSLFWKHVTSNLKHKLSDSVFIKLYDHLNVYELLLNLDNYTKIEITEKSIMYALENNEVLNTKSNIHTILKRFYYRLTQNFIESYICKYDDRIDLLEYAFEHHIKVSEDLLIKYDKYITNWDDVIKVHNVSLSFIERYIDKIPPLSIIQDFEGLTYEFIEKHIPKHIYCNCFDKIIFNKVKCSVDFIIEVANYKKSNPNFLLDTDNPYYNLKFHIGDINITLKELDNILMDDINRKEALLKILTNTSNIHISYEYNFNPFSIANDLSHGIKFLNDEIMEFILSNNKYGQLCKPYIFLAIYTRAVGKISDTLYNKYAKSHSNDYWSILESMYRIGFVGLNLSKLDNNFIISHKEDLDILKFINILEYDYDYLITRVLSYKNLLHSNIAKTIVFSRDVIKFNPCAKGVYEYTKHTDIDEKISWKTLIERHSDKRDITWFLYNRNCFTIGNLFSKIKNIYVKAIYDIKQLVK